MSASNIEVFNGAVVLPSGFAMDVQTMRIHEKQDKENVTAYASQTGTIPDGDNPNGNENGGSLPTNYGVWLGNGTPMQDITVTGFPYKGTALSNPGFGQMSLGLNADADTGAAAEFQVDNGCTLAGTYLVDDLSMDHSRIVAGAKTTLTLANTGDITVTWATS